LTQAQEASAKIATRRKAPKQLRFRDLLFISFGGQAPLISMLTFGTAMIALAGSGAALAMIIATTIVSVNGLVVYYLSRRFKRGGGYYVYAYYS
jgi:amino acid transporter